MQEVGGSSPPIHTVDVAEWLRHWIVAPDVVIRNVGSNPTVHTKCARSSVRDKSTAYKVEIRKRWFKSSRVHKTYGPIAELVKASAS